MYGSIETTENYEGADRQSPAVLRMLVSIFLRSFYLFLENNIGKNDLSFYCLFLAADDHAYILSAL